MPIRNFWVRKTWLPSIFGRATALFMAVSLITLYFYLLGNIQGFSDSTLNLLIEIELRLLSMAAVFGALSAITYIATKPLRNKRHLAAVFFSILAAALSFVLYLGVALLRTFQDGYGGI